MKRKQFIPETTYILRKIKERFKIEWVDDNTAAFEGLGVIALEAGNIDEDEQLTHDYRGKKLNGFVNNLSYIIKRSEKRCPCCNSYKREIIELQIGGRNEKKDLH